MSSSPFAASPQPLAPSLSLAANPPAAGSALAVPDRPVPPRRSSDSVGRRWLAFALGHPLLLLAGLFGFFLLLAAVAPGLLVRGDPFEASARLAFRAPSPVHPFGTDENGRDVLTRVVFGVRPSLLLGAVATGIALGSGIAIGLLAGLGRRFVDSALMRGVDVLLAFPHILLALVIITFWGQGTINTMVAVGIAGIPRYARLVRAQIQTIRHSAYVEAAVTLGLSSGRVIWRHVLPNAIKPALILASIGLGETIGFGAALSFLGLGAPPPAPEWGAMLSVGRDFLANAWWLTAFPAFAITATVLALTGLGRELLRRSEGKTVP